MIKVLIWQMIFSLFQFATVQYSKVYVTHPFLKKNNPSLWMQLHQI